MITASLFQPSEMHLSHKFVSLWSTFFFPIARSIFPFKRLTAIVSEEGKVSLFNGRRGLGTFNAAQTLAFSPHRLEAISLPQDVAFPTLPDLTP